MFGFHQKIVQKRRGLIEHVFIKVPQGKAVNKGEKPPARQQAIQTKATANNVPIYGVYGVLPQKWELITTYCSENPKTMISAKIRALGVQSTLSCAWIILS